MVAEAPGDGVTSEGNVRAGFTGEVGASLTLGSAGAQPTEHRFVLPWHVDQNDVCLLQRLDANLLRSEHLHRITGLELVGIVELSRATDEVEVAGSALAEAVLCSDARIERGHEDRRVLVHLHDIAAVRAEA